MALWFCHSWSSSHQDIVRAHVLRHREPRDTVSELLRGSVLPYLSDTVGEFLREC